MKTFVWGCDRPELFDEGAIFSSAWKVNTTPTSFKQRLSFTYDNSIDAYT